MQHALALFFVLSCFSFLALAETAIVTLSDGAFAGVVIACIVGSAILTGLFVCCLFCCQLLPLADWWN